jgi:hypothetical protein
VGTKKSPSWEAEDDDRVRVLIECQHTDSPAIIASVIEREGYAVRTCTGPDAGGCDLVDHGNCALVDGADVVVNLLRDPVEGPRIADAVASVRRPPALVVERPRPRATDEDSSTAPGATVVHPPVTRASLVAAIDDALAPRTDPPPT